MELQVSEATTKGKACRFKNEASSETFLPVARHLGSGFLSTVAFFVDYAEQRLEERGEVSWFPQLQPLFTLGSPARIPGPQLLPLHVQTLLQVKNAASSTKPSWIHLRKGAFSLPELLALDLIKDKTHVQPTSLVPCTQEVVLY